MFQKEVTLSSLYKESNFLCYTEGVKNNSAKEGFPFEDLEFPPRFLLLIRGNIHCINESQIQMHEAFRLNKKVNIGFRNKAVNIYPCFPGQKQVLEGTVSKDQT